MPGTSKIPQKIVSFINSEGIHTDWLVSFVLILESARRDNVKYFSYFSTKKPIHCGYWNPLLIALLLDQRGNIVNIFYFSLKTYVVGTH